MKKSILLSIGLIAGTMVYSQVQTPARSPRAKVEQKVGLTNFEINYSRPSLKERDLHKEIVPLDKLWRFGADGTTSISFDTPVVIEGTEIQPGTYAIFTIPGKADWKMFLYTDYEGWGAPKELDEEKIVSTFKVKAIENKEKVETFTLSFDDLSNSNSTSLNAKWDNFILPIKIDLPTKELTQKSIEDVMRKEPTERDYYRSATYYLNEKTELETALKYVDKAIQINGNAPTYYYYTKALILEGLGKKDAATQAAKESMKIAESSGMEEYVRKNKDLIQRLSL